MVVHDLIWLVQGDINHWVAVLDHFDSFLEQKVSQRSDVQLQGEGAAQDPPFPTDTCLAVLSATCVLLENCSNKAAYNSSEVRHLPAGCNLPVFPGCAAMHDYLLRTLMMLCIASQP